MARNVSEIKAKMKLNGGSGSTEKDESSYTTSEKIKKIKEKMKSSGIKFDIDEEYINKYIEDAQSFLSSAEEDYKGIEWGNASSTYDSKYETYRDLSDRADYIKSWLNVSKDRLDEETYNNLSNSLESISKGTSSAVKGFEAPLL